jgi:hypothetical protein
MSEGEVLTLKRLLLSLALISAVVASCAFAQSTITIFAGRDPKFEGDGQPAVLARIGMPRGIALDSRGNIYFTDSGFSLVMKADTEGRLSVLPIPLRCPDPNALSLTGRAIFTLSMRN